MKACGAGKNFREIIARNVEGGGADSAPPPPPPGLLGLKQLLDRAKFIKIVVIILHTCGAYFHRRSTWCQKLFILQIMENQCVSESDAQTRPCFVVEHNMCNYCTCGCIFWEMLVIATKKNCLYNTCIQYVSYVRAAALSKNQWKHFFFFSPSVWSWCCQLPGLYTTPGNKWRPLCHGHSIRNRGRGPPGMPPSMTTITSATRSLCYMYF